MVKKLLQYWTDSDWPCDFISDQRVKTAWKPNISNSVTQYLRLLPNRRYGGALCVVYIWKMTLTYHNVIKNPRKCNSWRVEIDLIFITDEMFVKCRNKWINFTIFFLFWSTVHTFQVSHLKIFFSIKPSCMNGNYSSLERHFFGCLINNFFENFVHLSSKYYDEPKKIHFHCVSFLSKDDD